MREATWVRDGTPPRVVRRAAALQLGGVGQLLSSTAAAESGKCVWRVDDERHCVCRGTPHASCLADTECRLRVWTCVTCVADLHTSLKRRSWSSLPGRGVVPALPEIQGSFSRSSDVDLHNRVASCVS